MDHTGPDLCAHSVPTLPVRLAKQAGLAPIWMESRSKVGFGATQHGCPSRLSAVCFEQIPLHPEPRFMHPNSKIGAIQGFFTWAR